MPDLPKPNSDRFRKVSTTNRQLLKVAGFEPDPTGGVYPILDRDPYDIAIGSFVTQSILDMRERLRRELRGLSTNSVLQEGLRAMQAACRMFLDENQSARSGYGPPYEAQLHSTLGELRALFGIHIARIACAYDLEVDAHLEGILPPEPD
jgi:hypothetical protein